MTTNRFIAPLLLLFSVGCIGEETQLQRPYYCHKAEAGWEPERFWDYSVTLTERSNLPDEDWESSEEIGRQCQRLPYNVFWEGRDASGFAHKFSLFFPFDTEVDTLPPLDASGITISTFSDYQSGYWNFEAISEDRESQVYFETYGFFSSGETRVQAVLGRDLGSSPNFCGSVLKKSALMSRGDETIELSPGQVGRLGSLFVANFDSVFLDTFGCNSSRSGSQITWGAWTR